MLKEFADDKLKCDENGRKFFKQKENTGKSRNCLLRGISPFPTVISRDLYCRHIKKQGLFWKGLLLLLADKGEQGVLESVCLFVCVSVCLYT